MGVESPIGPGKTVSEPGLTRGSIGVVLCGDERQVEGPSAFIATVDAPGLG